MDAILNFGWLSPFFGVVSALVSGFLGFFGMLFGL